MTTPNTLSHIQGELERLLEVVKHAQKRQPRKGPVTASMPSCLLCEALAEICPECNQYQCPNCDRHVHLEGE